MSHLSETTFESLNLHPHLMEGINKAEFKFCTPIQAGTLPIALQGKDVAGQAQTGTGKTAAFLLATLHKLLTEEPAEDRKQKQIRALMLAPTRELAIQIHKDAVVLAEGTGLKLALAYGGTDYDKQRDAIAAGCDILIGTPGRVIDYFKQGVFDMKRLEVAVLDEADRMFDLGFIKDVRYMFHRMPPADQRLNLLFSATLSFKVTELAYEHMNMPEKVKIESDQVTADNVEQSVYYPASDEKIPLLMGLLKQMEPNRSMVFVNTKRVAERLEAWLKANGRNCAVLSGDVPQKKRQSLLKQFQQGEIPMLVTTDVAARGLHINDVTHVFNYDLPQDAEDYVHRIGRTGRAGREGKAIMICEPRDEKNLGDIERLVQSEIPRGENPLKVEKPKPAPAPAAAPEEVSDKPEKRSRSRKKTDAAPVEPTPEAKPKSEPRTQSRRSSGSNSVVGMGDHMPSFIALSFEERRAV